ncbi:unnamed protein product [Adineta steineri]|uniref:Ionotropic glutamate receptor C-terminal domain-containing protein n=1 Tax=Adineta steineri TaxID=433720 RepID=A0A815QC72_9BILA|nr:unnamed protein product [Adineta steineri]CAF1633079.1 unnamed protein product [Adineta steineri]
MMMIILSQQYNITIDGQYLEWQSTQINGSELDAVRSLCQALSNWNIVGIVGPELSSQTPIIAEYGEKVVPSDSAAAIALIKLFLRFQWNSCILIYQNDAFGIDGSNAINNAFNNNNLTVVNQIMFNIDTLNFQSDLKTSLMSSSTRIVILWASSIYTSLILQNALDAGVVGPQFMWILSTSISLNSFNQSFYPNLTGILTIEQSIASVANAPMNNTLLNAAYNIWQEYEPETFPGSTQNNSLSLIQIYYLLQNCRSSSNDISFVPVLSYVDYTGWQQYQGDSVIIWPGQSLSIPTGNAQLKGITLRIGVIPSDPFTMVKIVTDQYGQNQTQLTGYCIDLISLLQANLGFIPNIQLAPSGVTYDGLMGMIPSVYDIVVADTTVTPARREVVDFSQGFFSNAISVLMLTNPAVKIDLMAFLKPFSTSLSLLILGIVLFSSMIICLLERQDNEELKEQSIISLCAMSVWYTYGTLIGGYAGFDLQTGPGRLLTAGLYMLSIVLVASCTANLASDLTIQNSQSLISGLDYIKAGKIPFNRLGIQVGTSNEDFYLTEISNNQTNFYPLYSKQQLYDSLLNGTIDAAFIGSGTAQYITSIMFIVI